MILKQGESEEWRIDAEKAVQKDPILQKFNVCPSTSDLIKSTHVMLHIEPDFHSFQTFYTKLHVEADLTSYVAQVSLFDARGLVGHKVVLP